MGIQVELLTQNKSCHQKEFIDFEFNEKHISEFGLVAVINGDRHSIAASPDFTDETSEVNGADGQLFWGTSFEAKQKNFNLATDGMTEKQLNAFKKHFAPGKYGRFAEDTYSNRYNWARIHAVSNFQVIPFKKIVTICGTPIETNIYKGEATISFVFDDPFFYAKENLIETIDDAGLRAMYVNGTPTITSWAQNTPCFIGDGYLMNGAHEDIDADMSISSNMVNLYNPSTAAAKPVISLKFNPTIFSNAGVYYFGEIADDINGVGGSVPYNKITINDSAGEVTSRFHYTSPDVVYSINKAIKIAADFYTNGQINIVELEEKLHNEIVNEKVMAWAASCLAIIQSKPQFYSNSTLSRNGTIALNSVSLGGASLPSSVSWFRYFNYFMLTMLANIESLSNDILENCDYSFHPYIVTFDSQNCQTLIDYSYNKFGNDSFDNFLVMGKKCGEMTCSNYLLIEGGDSLDDEGEITSTHKMYFRKGTSLSTVEITGLEYKYTYL